MRWAAFVLFAGCYFEPDPPVVANIAFVTSRTMPASNIAGLAGGDTICNDAAALAHLPGHFVAWLSDSSTAASTRLGTHRGWVRTDGKPFADQVSDIIAGRIFYPLRIDENGDDVVEPAPLFEQTLVATGTSSDGTDDSDCMDFSQQPSANVVFGVPDATTNFWTDHAVAGEPCSTVSRLYCFGDDRSDELPAPVPEGSTRLAFLSHTEFMPGAGRGAADQMCTDEANAAGVPGAFAALLGSTTGVPAAQLATGAPWVRPDGVVVSTDLRSLDAPINVTLDHHYSGAEYTWGGAQAFDVEASASETCDDWTDIGSTAIVGYSNRSDKHALFITTGRSCNGSYPVYCVER